MTCGNRRNHETFPSLMPKSAKALCSATKKPFFPFLHLVVKVQYRNNTVRFWKWNWKIAQYTLEGCCIRMYIDNHTITSAQNTQDNSLWSVFIRDSNKAISDCAATVVVITESIRDVQTAPTPFLWETYRKGQKINGWFGTSDSWRCTFLHLPQITRRTLRLWCGNKPK